MNKQAKIPNSLEFNELQVLSEIETIKLKINNFRPFSKNVEAKVMQKLRINWNYHSNAIEGNKLSYGETVALLMHGITAKGKPLKDHLDIQGHDSAISMMLDLIKQEKVFTQNDIRELHAVILKEPYDVFGITQEGEKVRKSIKIGQYKTEANHVRTKTGEIHYYSEPQFVGSEMSDLLTWLGEQLELNYSNSIVIASLFHHRFVAIHPFDDGNGRLARILMNFILMHNSYPPVVIKQSEKDGYYGALAEADAGEFESIIKLIANGVKDSLEIQLDALEGKEISSLEDLDKEIELFKASLSPAQKGKFKKNGDVVKQLIQSDILPFLREVESKFVQFNELFKSNSILCFFTNSRMSHKSYMNYKEFEKEIKDFLNQGYTDMDSIEYKYNLKEYKTSSTNQSLSISFKFSFKDYYYELVTAGCSNNSFRRTYDKSFDIDVRQDNIRQTVKSLISLIKKISEIK